MTGGYSTLYVPIDMPLARGQKARVPVDLWVYGSQGDSWLIPRGFRTDLASVPSCCRWLQDDDDPLVLQAALAHDRLCEDARTLGSISRRDADGVFRMLLRQAGMSWARRWLLWAAVRLGGGFSGGISPKEAGQFALIVLLTAMTVLIPLVSALAWITQTLFSLLERITR